MALVDSGNMFRNVISYQFLQKMGLSESDLRPISDTTVGTAKKGDRLQVLGETKKTLPLRLGGLPFSFKIRPAVIKGLSMEVNLCGP